MTMMTRLALLALGIALGFVITWVLGAATWLSLAAGLPIFIAGAVIGFVGEWFLDEAYRKNRELQQTLQKREAAIATPLIQVTPPERLSLTEQEDSVPTRRLLGLESGRDVGTEALANFLHERDEELREIRQQLDTQIDSLRTEFETYQRTHPDNLTVIKGIGPVYQWKLRDVGFNTYKQLAAADPDQLRRMLDVKKWQRVNCESWIAQARDWAERVS